MFHVSVIRVIPNQYAHHLNYILMNDVLKQKHSLNHLAFQHFIGYVSQFPMSTNHRILPTSSTSTKIVFSYNQTERSDIENSENPVEQCPSQLQKSNYAIKTSIFVLLGLAIVMLTIYFFVQVRFRKKVNTPIAHI